MSFGEKKCSDFINELYSKAAVPGGGGAAALSGALGAALAGMVGNLTAGKKTYAEFEDDIQRILRDSKELQERLMKMVDEDAENFEPLAKAYGLPKDTDEQKAYKDRQIQELSKLAAKTPIEIVKASYDGIVMHRELVDKGSKLAISDVGVGVQCLRTALLSGWLNVIINLSAIKDEEFVSGIENELKPLISKGIEIADDVYNKVEEKLS